MAATEDGPPPGGNNTVVSISSSMDAADILAIVCRAPRSERRMRLAELCGHDEELKNELLEMLELREKRQDRKQVSVPPVDSLVAGRYLIREELGRGATAIVFRAHDCRTERDVALKVFTRTPSRRMWRRVAREAQSMGLVDSPHVVRMYDVSGEEDELLWISLELCCEHRNNTPIGAVALLEKSSQCDGRPASVKEAAAWAEQIALGIHEAHLKGVFHRDLKPANILLQPVNRKAKVGDFGQGTAELHRQAQSTDVDASHTDTSQRTMGGPYGGTPQYMAPEQVNETVIPLNPELKRDREQLAAIDIYGIGATLYELVAGRPPYLPTEGATNHVWDVLEQLKKGPPKPLAQIDTAWPVPERLRRIIETAMARNAKERYASAADLAKDLGAFVRDEPSSLDRRRRDIPLRIGLFLKRNRSTVLQVAFVAVVFIIFVFASALSLHVTGKGLKDTQQNLKKAKQELTEVHSQKKDLERELEVRRKETAQKENELKKKEQDLHVAMNTLAETMNALAVQKAWLARTTAKLNATSMAQERADGQISQLNEKLGEQKAKVTSMGTFQDKLLDWVATAEMSAETDKEKYDNEHALRLIADNHYKTEKESRRIAEEERTEALRAKTAAEGREAEAKTAKDFAENERNSALDKQLAAEAEVSRLKTQLEELKSRLSAQVPSEQGRPAAGPPTDGATPSAP